MLVGETDKDLADPSNFIRPKSLYFETFYLITLSVRDVLISFLPPLKLMENLARQISIFS